MGATRKGPRPHEQRRPDLERARLVRAFLCQVVTRDGRQEPKLIGWEIVDVAVHEATVSVRLRPIEGAPIVVSATTDPSDDAGFDADDPNSCIDEVCERIDLAITRAIHEAGHRPPGSPARVARLRSKGRAHRPYLHDL